MDEDELRSLVDQRATKRKGEDDVEVEFANRGRDWLTYETFFNQPNFRRTNQQRELGLYTMPIDKTSVYLTSGIPTQMLDLLRSAFFPEIHENDHLLQWSQHTCPWREPCGPPVFTPDTSSGSRGENILHATPRVVLPYNSNDNTSQSNAIGTQEKSPRLQVRLTKLKDTWPCWATASRSCIVDFRPVNPDDTSTPYTWDFLIERRLVSPDLEKEHAKATHFVHAQHPQCVSLKTGVTHVGRVAMRGKKESLATDIFMGSLQSDYIAVTNKHYGHNNVNDEDLVILLELMGISEGGPGSTARGDGVLVRDLSALRTDRIYIPAISIPFLDVRLQKLCRRYEAYPDTEWQDLWERAYAEALGRAKALLLLRYGLMMETPNAQNFLLEFDPSADPPQPTGRLILRDLGDALFVGDVFWALHTTRKTDRSQVASGLSVQDFTLPSVARMYPHLQPHITTKMRLAWHDFSALTKARTVADGASEMSPDPDARSPGWRFHLHIMAKWGLAHAKAFAGALLERWLGQLPSINWKGWLDSYPDPSQYLALNDPFSGMRDKQTALSDWDSIIGADLRNLSDRYIEWEHGLDADLMANLFANSHALDDLRTSAWAKPGDRWDWDAYLSPPQVTPQTSSYRSTTSNTNNPNLDFVQDWDDDDGSNQ